MALGIAVLVTNAVAAGWGAVGWLRGNARAALAFWPLLRVAQASVTATVKVKVPDAVGIPARLPLDSNRSPGGRGPLARPKA